MGAGLAGLAAADRLVAGGRNVVVFEATDRVGGRQRSGTVAGALFEEGPVFYGDDYHVLRRIVSRAGLDRDLKGYEVADIAAVPGADGGRPGRAPGTPLGLLLSPVLSPVEKIRLAGLVAALATHAGEVRELLSVPVSSRWLRHLDDVDAERYFTSRVGGRFVERIVTPILESLGFAPAPDWSALGAILLLSFATRRHLYALNGGLDQIARHLAGGLDVVTGAAVTRVAPPPAGVELDVTVGGVSATRRFNDVVVAVPAPLAAELLGGELSDAAAAFPYSASVVPAIAVRSVPFPIPAVSFYSFSDMARRPQPISGITIEQAGPDEPVVCFAALRQPWIAEMFDAHDAEIVALLVELVETAAGEPVEVLDEKVVRWRHAVPVTAPGTMSRREAALHAAGSVSHLEIAGDWLVSPSQEGALVSGERAAERLLTA